MAHEEYIRHVDGGDTAVLFIHGFLGSPEHFKEFVKAVPENCAVYNVLLTGHGGTVRDFANASMEKWKDQVGGIIDELAERYGKIIIAAHSMGTFFAMEAANRLPDVIKAVFLMQTPLKIGVKAVSFINTFKSFFNLVSENDDVGKAYINSHSVKLNKRIWQYIGWVPRYLELFAESKKARGTILAVDVPCYIFQSLNDELVSMKSMEFIPNKSCINTTVLKNSSHFIYSKEDFAMMKAAFCDLFIE